MGFLGYVGVMVDAFRDIVNRLARLAVFARDQQRDTANGNPSPRMVSMHCQWN